MLTRIFHRGAGAVLFCLSLFSLVTPAQAINFQGDDWTIRIESNLSLGGTVRLEDPDLNLIGRANSPDDSLKAGCATNAGQGGAGCGQAYSTNGDDGNLAYDKGDMVHAVSKLTSDVTLNWGDVGVFLRGSYFFDLVNSEKSFFDPRDFDGDNNASPADRARKIDALKNHIGFDFDLLDAYVFGNVDLFDRTLSYRLGRQVLNWGESTFVLNGINSIVALDANQARLPGASVDEIFIPQGMVFLAADVTDNVSMELFYQYEWEHTEIDTAGSFYSTSDIAGIGGETAEIGFGRCAENSPSGSCQFAPNSSAAPRFADRDAEDGGQGGISLRWYIEELNDLDLAFYYAKYHSRLPLVSGIAAQAIGDPSTSGYFIEYPEDISLYGVSFNTLLPWGGVSMQGEYSLKVDQPLQVDDVELLIAGTRAANSQVGAFGPGDYIQGFRRRDVSQFDVSFTKLFGPSALLRSAQTLFLFEAAVVQVHDLPDTETLRFEAPGTYTPGDPLIAASATGGSVPPEDPDNYADDLSWGYKVAARLEYNNIFNVLTVRPSVVFQHDVEGTSPTPILNFIDERKQVRVGVEADYLSKMSFGVVYNRSWDGGLGNLLTDRDTIGANVKISF